MRKLLLLIVGAVYFLQGSSQSAEALYKQGLQLKEEKKASLAREAFREAVKLKPDYAEALYEIGWCSNDLRDYTSALSSLKKAAPLWPDIPKVFFEMGYAYQQLELNDSALANYKKCLSLKSDYTLVYRQLGKLYYDKDDYTTALENYNHYVNIATAPITDYLFWYRKGFCENALKKFTDAVVSMKKSLAIKTDYLNTYLELGFSYSRQKLNDSAISYYKKAIELKPDDYVAYNGIGEVYRDNVKNQEEAMSWYKKSLGIKSTERKACFGMGYCLNSLGRYSEAIPYLKTAIENEQDYTAAYVELGYSYYRTNAMTDAMTNLNKALSINPNNGNARYYKGLIYISQKDKINAQKMVDELKPINAANAATLQESVNKM